MQDLNDDEFLIIASDIHDNESVLASLSKLASTSKCLAFLYAGDLNIENYFIEQQVKSACFPFLPVQGNCDSPWSWADIGLTLPSYRTYSCKGLNLFITHGHLYSRPSDVGLSDEDFDIVITGHTHMNTISVQNIGDKTVTYVNPGSPTRPRGGTKASYAVIVFKKDGSADIQIRALDGNGLLAQKDIAINKCSERND